MDDPLSLFVQFLSFGYGFGALFSLLVVIYLFYAFRQGIAWAFKHLIIPFFIGAVKLIFAVLSLYFWLPTEVGIDAYKLCCKKDDTPERSITRAFVMVIYVIAQLFTTAVPVALYFWLGKPTHWENLTEFAYFMDVLELSAKICMMAFLGANLAQIIYKASTRSYTHYCLDPHQPLLMRQLPEKTTTKTYQLPESFFELTLDLITDHWFDYSHSS